MSPNTTTIHSNVVATSSTLSPNHVLNVVVLSVALCKSNTAAPKGQNILPLCKYVQGSQRKPDIIFNLGKINMRI